MELFTIFSIFHLGQAVQVTRSFAVSYSIQSFGKMPLQKILPLIVVSIFRLVSTIAEMCCNTLVCS